MGNNKSFDVAFFGVNEKQVKVITTTKAKRIPTTLEGKIKQEVKESIKSILIKHGAKNYQFETLETNGKDKETKIQLYKRVEKTQLSIPIPTSQEGKKGFKMFYIDTWNKATLTPDYKEKP